MKKAKIDKQIKKAGMEIQELMEIHLAAISDNMINQVIKTAKRLPQSQILNSIKGIKPVGVNAYRQDMLATMAVISKLSLDQVKSEIPGLSKKFKLFEDQERLLFGEFEKLPSGIRKRIVNSNNLLIGTQIADIEKAIFFQFKSSANAELPLKEIQSDMRDKAEKYIDGNAIKAGSMVTAANVVNEARSAFFTDKQVLEQVDAFQFMNGDPVSAICNDLAGTVFRKDDPDFFKYTPPLHYNCKSWMRAIPKGELENTVGRNGEKGKAGLEKLKPSTKKIEDTIQFDDILEATNESCQCKCCIKL